MAPDLPLLPGLLATTHRYLWCPDSQTAILADLHLGIQASLAKAGLYLPDIWMTSLCRVWDELVSRGPAHVIMAGDVFDAPQLDAEAVALCRDLFAKLPAACRVTITPGNHDPLELSTLWNDLSVEVRRAIRLGPWLISHGHEIPADLRPGQTWIVGHQHPAVTLSTAVQSAKMPCYALCQSPKRAVPSLVILPAFSRAPLGSNLLTVRHWLLPLPRPANADIRIFGLVERESPAETQVLDFGPLAMLA